jgi:catechol-2,3-dioxygenase
MTSTAPAVNVKAGYPTPLLHVADVERSLRFYSLLGFETVDIDRADGSIGWARVHSDGGAIMFLRAEESQAARHDRFLLYLYTPNLPALCTHLSAADIEVGPISHPDYMRSGEICLKDPDGYIILIGHWGEREHEAWKRQRERKRAAGLIP